MGKSKKRTTKAAWGNGDGEYNKRARPSVPDQEENGRSRYGEASARIDPSTGLRSAFPGLDDDEGELFYGPASDGMEYLRMVRSEAKGVPDLLVAPKETQAEVNDDIYDSGYGDSRGYYADGAYTAAVDPDTMVLSLDAEDEGEGTEAQDVYYESLLHNYRLLRANLRVSPPHGGTASFDSDHPTQLSLKSKASYAHWRHLLQTTDPIPLQIASMDQETVLRLVGIVTSGLLKRGRNLDARLGRWIWALLARLREAGCLVSEEISVVRELGKRAVWLLAALKQGAVKDASDEQLADEGDDVALEDDVEAVEQQDAPGGQVGASGHLDRGIAESEGEAATDAAQAPLPPVDHANGITKAMESEVEEGEVEDDDPPIDKASIEAAKARLISQLSADRQTSDSAAQDDTETPRDEAESAYPSWRTRATLDMIVTIVGEYYGQRDLLEFRELWDENV